MEASRARRHQLDALADPTRRAILELLRERPLTAGEIAARFSQQRPAISKHLTLLRTTGWLAESRDRQRRIYSLRNDAVVVVVDWVRRLGEACQPRDDQSRGREGSGSLPNKGRTGLEDCLTIEHPGCDAREARSQQEAQTSDIRSEIAVVGVGGAGSGEASVARNAPRSSFELIFD